jgi:hypothetical protein
MQQKEEKGAPAHTQSEQSQGSKKQVQQKEQGSAQHAQGKVEPSGKGAKGSAEPKQMEKSTKGTAQGETPERAGKAKGTTQKGAEEGKAHQGTAQTPLKDQGTKGTAQTQQHEQGTKGATTKESTKGTAQTQQHEQNTKGATTKETTKGTAQTQQHEQGTKGATSKESTKGTVQTQQREQGTKGTAAETGKGQEPTLKPSETAKGPSGGGHMQLSEQQRGNVHDTILKERHVNRVSNVNFTVDVGARVPRHVHLASLPASVVHIVPEYRDYRYFVVDDEICIVQPNTYEIVDVMRAPGRTTARVESRGARLTLSDNEKRIILNEVGTRGGSTLALGALTEGAEVPRGVELRSFPEEVVAKVPKVRDYKYFTAEDRVAICDPESEKIAAVIEEQR